MGLSAVSADAEAALMPSSAKKADYRATLLLVLALVPIAGALIGTVAYWKNEENERIELQQSNDPVQVSYGWFALLEDYEDARVKLEIASWPGATEVHIASAAEARQTALDSLTATEAQIIPLTSRIAEDIGVDTSRFIRQIISLFAMSREALEAQQPGAALLPGFLQANEALIGAFAGRYVPQGDMADNTLRVHRLVLYDLFAYHASARKHLVPMVEALNTRQGAEESLPMLEEATRTDPTLAASWSQLRFNYSLIADNDGFALAGTVATLEPVAQLVESGLDLSASDQSSFDADRSRLAAEIIGLTETMRADVDLLFERGNARMAFLDAELEDQQRLATAIGALLALLGVGLLALTAVEIRHRRQVEEDHRDALARLDSKAQTDPLTGAGNRRRFERVLEQRLDQQEREGSVVLAYVDLDRFKALNDVWGRTTGDQVLRIIAKRLQKVGNENNAEVIRFGGDEFICFASVKSARQIDASELGGRLLEAVRQPIVVDGERHQLTATAGVAVSDERSTADSLLLEADRSLMLGKRTQRGSTVTSDEATAKSGRLVKILPTALQNGEITCHYQPVFSIDTGELLHVEALSRWRTPDGENISPGTFVPLIEAFGMSSSLTRSVLNNISEVMASGDVPDHVGFWLNVAPLELEEFNFAERLLDDIAALNLPAARLAIEITETAAISDPTHFAEQVGRLAAVGIEIAIDDFGSGYSPLGYLQDLPVDVVKIDRSLINHIDTHQSNQQLLKGIIGMLKLQGRQIVAEGVERPEELRWLHDHGVDMVQGFLTARPSPASEIKWGRTPVPSAL